MTSQKIKTVLFAMLISVVGVLATMHFSEKLPFAYAYGCDSYGYLRQAELFKKNGLLKGLDTAIQAENAMLLVDVAAQINTNVSRWSEMIAPHCHHYSPENHKIILQYPPGTGFVLSLLPAGKELEALSLLLVLSIVCWWSWLNFRAASGGLFLISTSSAILFLATATQFQVPSYSVPLTIVLLAWIALLLFETRYVATAKNLLLAAAIGLLTGTLLTVRIASILVLPSIAMIAYFKMVEAHREHRFSFKVPAVGCGAFVCTLSPLLVANWVNAGGPFKSTYNDYDTKVNFGNVELLFNNLSYYLIENRVAALSVLALSVLTLGLVTSKPQRRTDYRIGVALMVVFFADLLFLSIKMVAIDYYFLPTAAFSLYAGLLLYSKDAAEPAKQLSKPASVVAMIFVVLLLVLAVDRLQATSKIDVSLSVPAEILAPNSIVYADNSGGTIHLYKQKYTAKISFGNYCMREQLISRVQATGHTQYFVNDSVKMNEAIEAMGLERFTKVGVASSQHFQFDVLKLLPSEAMAVPQITCDFGAESEIVSKVVLQPIGKVEHEKFVGYVTITNASATPFSTLPNVFPVRLSWRFLDASDQSAAPAWLARQDLRTLLAPGVPYQVPVSIGLPERTGNYVLEFSLVQEGYVWFHDRGMPIARINVKVER